MKLQVREVMIMNNDDYEVGYKKPPKNTRFGAANGNPINRKGAPSKSQKILAERFSHEIMRKAFIEAGEELVTINDGEEQIKVQKIQALPKTIINKALKGDLRASTLFMRYADKYAQEQEKIVVEIVDSTLKLEEEQVLSSLELGSYRHYHAMYHEFMCRRAMRKLDGNDSWIYLPYEPMTDSDWKVFLECYNLLASGKRSKQPWPPPYEWVLEERRLENMSEKERLQDFLQTFEHRKAMREKEGVIKWPYMVEEPADDKDWVHFRQYIQDHIDEKENPTMWPPAYWKEE
jgi:hypothetical protein